MKPRQLPMAATCNCMFAVPRALVSQNKRRFQEDGFDLDLCYLHPRVIVMGFPSVGMETMYRNPRNEVVRLLETRHEGLYKVFNFCSESNRQYSPDVFDGRVSCYPIEDHNVPSFDQLFTFCEDAAAWLHENEHHIVVLHCKAGKGRAGMMACMLLLRMGFAPSAADAIQQYNRLRVRDMRGLTVVSQKKWVHYYEQLWQENQRTPLPRPIPQKPYVIRELSIRNGLTAVEPPLLRVRIYMLTDDSSAASLDSNEADSSTPARRPTKTLVHQSIGQEQFALNEDIRGSVLIEFRSINCGNCVITKHFKVWFNTRFLQPNTDGRVVFSRDELDWVSRDKKMRRFPAAFDLEIRVLRSPLAV
ncbi:TPA: hypothetical protein N0F65_011172 [Lagenidium giganteum]|uniref:Phosphatidylinositol-3,4,5-trisphosphate 3-phosphatase n=1 Tax=Lagenidium giganteum TaxID=4803 RepID=A0AAV2ZBY2_9STRA|nr:TPA: hypothetical protein N0F65_011172 [Lagenidium giganteum]